MKALEHIEEVAANLTSSGRPALAAKLQDAVNELRSRVAPLGPDGMMAQHNTSHFRAWSAIVDVLNEVRGCAVNWGADASLAPRDAAVATIRSMAAQCSARPAPDVDSPTGVAPLRQAQLDALQYAIGFLSAGENPREQRAADELDELATWLHTNAPRA